MVKLYHEELGSDHLTNFLTQYENDLVITISDLTKIELHSAFFKRVRMKEISLKAIDGIFAAFEKDASMFNVIEADPEVKNFAVTRLNRVARQKSLRTLEAIQLATALLSHQILDIDYFITADKKLLRVTKDYFHSFNPERAIP